MPRRPGLPGAPRSGSPPACASNAEGTVVVVVSRWETVAGLILCPAARRQKKQRSRGWKCGALGRVHSLRIGDEAELPVAAVEQLHGARRGVVRVEGLDLRPRAGDERRRSADAQSHREQSSTAALRWAPNVAEQGSVVGV